MIAALKVSNSFSHQGDLSQLLKNCRAFADEFGAKVECEFFYYLKASDPERFFFMRVRTKDRETFVQSVRAFAENLGFEVLTKDETSKLLDRIKLDTFI